MVKRGKKTLRNRRPTPHPKMHASYMNVSQTLKNGEGRRNTVIIRNGQGIKQVDLLGPNGQPMKTQTRRLTKAEKAQILEGQFINGLWRNCRIGSC